MFALILAGCSKGPDADLQYIKQARSLGAEWALVNQQAAESKVTTTYASSMHEWLRDQLQSASGSLTQSDSLYASEIQALLNQPDDAAPDQFRAHVEKLKQIEDRLESA